MKIKIKKCYSQSTLPISFKEINCSELLQPSLILWFLHWGGAACNPNLLVKSNRTRIDVSPTANPVIRVLAPASRSVPSVGWGKTSRAYAMVLMGRHSGIFCRYTADGWCSGWIQSWLRALRGIGAFYILQAIVQEYCFSRQNLWKLGYRQCV